MKKLLQIFFITAVFSIFLLSVKDFRSQAQVIANQEDNVEITLSAVGDCTLGWDVRYQNGFCRYYNRYGDNYFFKKVKKVFLQDDITLANFEGTLTDRTSRRAKAFTFRAPGKYVNILKKANIEVVNLANNHSEDFGVGSYKDTIQTLKNNEIGYCRNTKICYKKVNGIKMAFLGFDVVDGATASHVRKAMKIAKEHNPLIIVVSFHWGIERNAMPNYKQKLLGHLAIDQGASLVIGHHPHVLQGIETYKGKHILYSLGNFCFGGNSNPVDKDTMVYQETFKIKQGILKSSKGFVIPCSLSSHSSYNDYQPRVLSGVSAKRVIQKINARSRTMKTHVKQNGKVSIK